MFRKVRPVIALVTACVFAVSLLVTPPRALADGGKGSDSLQLIAPAVAPVVLQIFVALNLSRSPLAKRFHSITTAMTVIMFLSGSMMPLYLQALSQLSRRNPFLGAALQIAIIYNILIAMSFQFLPPSQAQKKNNRPVGFIPFTNFLLQSERPALPTRLTLPRAVGRVSLLYDDPDGVAALQRDAQAGDETAQVIQRVMPHLIPLVSRGRGWVDYGLLPRVSGPGSVQGLFLLPAYFLLGGGFLFDRKFWDRAMAEALEAWDDEEYLWDLEDDADDGDPSATAALLIFDELARSRYRVLSEPRIRTRLSVDPLIELRPDEALAEHGPALGRLRGNIYGAFGRSGVMPLWSKPLVAPPGTVASEALKSPRETGYDDYRAGGIDWWRAAAEKGGRNEVDRLSLTFNLRYQF